MQPRLPVWLYGTSIESLGRDPRLQSSRAEPSTRIALQFTVDLLSDQYESCATESPKLNNRDLGNIFVVPAVRRVICTDARMYYVYLLVCRAGSERGRTRAIFFYCLSFWRAHTIWAEVVILFGPHPSPSYPLCKDEVAFFCRLAFIAPRLINVYNVHFQCRR